jgi:hypothetical protein
MDWIVDMVNLAIWLVKKGDCVKTRLDFRKLLVLCTESWPLDVLHTYKAQFLEPNLTFHTVSKFD